MYAGGTGSPIYQLARQRQGDFWVYRLNDEESERLLAALLPDPDHLFSLGEPLVSSWQGTATDKVKVSVGEKKYFLKRYNCSGLFYRIKNLFRLSKALRAWKSVDLFLPLQIATPCPLLCLEERHWRFLGRSYLLFPFVEGQAENFLEYWPGIPVEQKLSCLLTLAEMIGRMHANGIFHGDLNWRNILVKNEGDRGVEFSLVDLDGSWRSSHPTRAHALKDLDHFIRDLHRANAGAEMESVFMACWKKTTRLFAH